MVQPISNAKMNDQSSVKITKEKQARDTNGQEQTNPSNKATNNVKAKEHDNDIYCYS
jgi:hypothetical protein